MTCRLTWTLTLEPSTPSCESHDAFVDGIIAGEKNRKEILSIHGSATRSWKWTREWSGDVSSRVPRGWVGVGESRTDGQVV